MSDSTEVLERLPKNTPIWAVGIVALIVAITVSFVTVYFTTKGEIRDYLNSNIQLQSKRADLETVTIESVLKVAESNARQITNLSEALNKAQDENLQLSKRVAIVEKQLSEAGNTLQKCLESLELCQSKKGKV